VTSRAEQYRRYARQCLEIAPTFQDEEARATLLGFAQGWSRLAHLAIANPHIAELMVQRDRRTLPSRQRKADRRDKHPKPLNQMTIGQFEEMFPHEDACVAYLVKRRWPEGIRCPRCGSDRVHGLKTMKWKWECLDCGKGGGPYKFSHLVGTVFENTNCPLKIWFRVIHMMLTSKTRISSLQIHRTIGTGSYQTVCHMCRRITGLVESEKKLAGIVEMGETYVGGNNKHRDKRGKGGTGGIG
jgi:hypothetical protein